jgi:Mrp family chromosome partitioning ATPase
MAVTDAVLAAGAASGALFVVGTEMVACREVRAAMERLAPANTRILGAVLNRVDLDRHAFYYASYYQRPAQKWYPNEI